MDNTVTSQQLEKINSFARGALTENDVYVFPVVLCDNEIDRDNERFSVSALKKLAELFVGKTGIFDHNPTGENQTARIFETAVETDSTRKTSAGEPYTALKGYAYMVKTSSNADLIREIDGGIKKEVSVSCSVKTTLCSVCGANLREVSCSHEKGKEYSGVKCHTILDNPTDAYEWSFVAVPAQVGAGVTKRFGVEGFDPSDELKSLREQLASKTAETKAYEAELRAEVVRLCGISRISFLPTLKAVAQRLSLSELIDLRSELAKTADDLEPQLFKPSGEARCENQPFKLNAK